MKKSIVFLGLTILTVLLLCKTEVDVNALDFASDYFNAQDVEVTPNSTIPMELGMSDYRYGMKLSTNKNEASVSLNDSFVGKFSIDMMAYSSVSYGSNIYESANYSNSYQDLNEFSIKFKNKSDSKEFSLVLNGGAKGNNVTVNAHVEVEDEKMGLYYSKNNKLVGNTLGANSSNVYTYLWGTSFSNVAVSSETYSSHNVKSVKLEFDPINMQVFGVSYGYASNVVEKLLIWDFKKESIDGSNSYPVLSSFDEYEVSLCFDSVNQGRTASVLIYSINGQKFSNTYINNSIGPVSSVVLNEGEVNQKYELPLPKAYDVLDGIISFEGTVLVYDPLGNKVDLKLNNDKYALGASFIPKLAGSYRVIYQAVDSKGKLGESLEQVINVKGNDVVSFNHGLDRVIYKDLGSEFEVVNAKALINNTEYAASYKLYDPSNEVINGSKVKLDKEGLYRLVYYVDTNENYSEEIKIYVSYLGANLFENNKCLDIKYDNAYLNNDVYGVVVNTNLETSYVTYKKSLDLSYLNGETCLVSLQANPKSWQIASFQAITVKLIDSKNPNNYVRVYCSASALGDTSYIRAGSASQRLAGLASDGTVCQTSSGGTSITHSFSGVAEKMDISSQKFELYFDYEEKKIYTTGHVLVADLDDSEFYSTLWTGFEGDEFEIEISISGVAEESSYIIDKIAGLDLTALSVVDINAPRLSYEEEDFIDGVVDIYYPIPVINYEDCNSKIVTTNVSVSLNDQDVKIYGDKFLPSELGRYKIVYEFIDNYGNVSTVVKRVLIKESVEPIDLVVSSGEVTGYVGENIVVPSYEVNGGSGEVSVEIKAVGKNTSQEYVLNDFIFVPEVADVYTIIYVASDRLGNTTKYEIEADIKLSSKPIISLPEFVPNVLVDGAVATFALPKAYDYNNGKKEVEVEIYLTIDGKEVVVTDAKHLIKLSKMNDEVLLKYKAKSLITNEVAELVYKIPAVKLYDKNGNLVVSQYLVTDGFDSVTSNENSIDLVATKSNASIEFIKNVYSDGFQVSFNVPSSANKVDMVTVYMVDSIDKDKVIKLDIVKANSTDSFSYLVINNDVKVTMVGTFYGTTANRLKIMYDASLNAIKDDSGLVVAYLKNYLNGENFTGFSSEIEFKIELGNVSGTTVINLYNIGNQIMSNIDGDYTVPAIVFDDEIVRISEINSVVSIPSANAIDILGFETNLTIKVLTPNKKEIYKSEDGKGTDITIDQYGTYYIYYIGEDDNGNSLTQIKLITVLDDIAPTITLENGIEASAKLNSSITLPNATYLDNVSSADNISTLIYVIDPNNVMTILRGDKVTFDVVGKYTIRHFAIDEAGNVSILDSVVEVE